MGATAAQLLLERIGGRQDARRRVFSPALRVRATSRSAPARSREAV
ncbi:MAG: transcriptional regulator [Microbacterium sp.]|jgi:LacI family transcriptional regulator|nr:transcriptional regulator [Microbacterium sp.]